MHTVEIVGQLNRPAAAATEDVNWMLHIQPQSAVAPPRSYQLITMLLFTYIYALRRAQCSRIPHAAAFHCLVHQVWARCLALRGISLPLHTCSRNAPTTATSASCSTSNCRSMLLPTPSEVRAATKINRW